MPSSYDRKLVLFGRPFTYISLASIPGDCVPRGLCAQGIVCPNEWKRLQTAGLTSDAHMHELFQAKWRELGFGTACLGLHSLRAGGAPAAFNASIGDGFFKRHTWVLAVRVS